MKKKLLLFTLVLVILSPVAFADYSEQAYMIKTDDQEHDTVIRRADGSKWLLQHNRVCRSMSTEFPINLIIKNNKINQLKVRFNEICKVYESAPYSGEGTLDELIKSKNLIIKDHEAVITWNNQKHLINYKGEGCQQLYEFVGKRVYFSFDKSSQRTHKLILPGNQGVCPFKLTESKSVIENTEEEALEIKGLDHQAQNNQVYFYWEAEKSLEKPYYGLAYSKRKINLDEYPEWKEMPNAKVTHKNSHTFRRLANGQAYYFYLTTLNQNMKPGKWKEVKATPTAPIIESADDPIEGEEEKFEVKIEDAGDHFLASWNEDSLARRYFVRLYVDGKRTLFKILKSDQTEWKIPKKEAYLGKGLRFTVRTLPKKAFWPRQKDGIYWKYE